MILYIADRNLNIHTIASHKLEGLRISSDARVESVETGAKSFDCELSYEEAYRSKVDIIVPGCYMLKHSADGEKEFYQIRNTEKNEANFKLTLSCDDAGLDLLNMTAPAYTATEEHTLEWYVSHFCGSNGWIIDKNESSGSKKLTWDSDATLTERLLSLASEFSCELSYGFDIRDTALKVEHKYLNFCKKRGSTDVAFQARLGRELANIITRRSTENLATAYIATGGTPNGKTKPVSLVGYAYHFADEDGGDEFATDLWIKNNIDPSVADEGKIRNLSACARWAGALDSDGLIVRTFQCEALTQADLASWGKSELTKYCDAEVNYDCEFNWLDANIGDRINVIDDKSGLYLESRILEITKSETDGSVSAVLGDHVIRSSGISQGMIDLSIKVQQEADRVNSLAGDVAAKADEADLSNYATAEELAAVDDRTLVGAGLADTGSGNLKLGDVADPEAYYTKIEADSITLNTGAEAVVSITPNGMEADNARISTLKMEPAEGSGSLAWVAQSNGHVTLKEI